MSLRAAASYAELHCHSAFSFLDGASHPEALVAEAVRLGLGALALTDHNGLYGVVRFAQAAREAGLRTVFGAELTLSTDGSRTGPADPKGHHLVVLARSPEGYRRLSRAISTAQLAGHKGSPRITLEELASFAAGHWMVLTGCRKGTVPAALLDQGPTAAQAALDRLVGLFGREQVMVELWDHGDPLDSARNDALARLAVRAEVGLLATNNVHYASPATRPLATALAAVRAQRSLDQLDGWLPPSGAAHLRTAREQAQRFARYPGVVERAGELGRELAFDLALIAPRLPRTQVPPGETEASWLRELTSRAATQRYGPRDAERVRGAWKQIDHELGIIEQLGFSGYFLIVWDIVEYCRRAQILCQGRGSAANSAVCYALGITNADAVGLGLLFERFLSPEREGPPDIDLDIEAGRREEVIQYVYRRYGREHAAQVSNVITYRPRSALRDMARALGYGTGQQDAWAREVEPWESSVSEVAPAPEPLTQGTTTLPERVSELASQAVGLPRHLGIHSGGMVLCDGPIIEVCPVEWATLPGRTVLQWDKDDCAAAGLVKFDLLGLGMLSALQGAVELLAAREVTLDLGHLPQEPKVYQMLCRADSIGVFQVESRAQMATLPRLAPERFYDLVVEVALIRPGPIQGGSVHPYLRRRAGREAVTYPHPLLERSLSKTLGVPLFQEQLMQMAVDAAGFTAAEADQLRQAMSAKRSEERMGRLRERLLEGMRQRGITGAVADEIYEKLSAFANFGFPESHAVSFAFLVYASAWIKWKYPAVFLASLLNAQPMGFYAPHTLVSDARRHGVKVAGPDVQQSECAATLEGENGVRLGLATVRGVGEKLAQRVVAERAGGPYSSLEDLVRRTNAGQLAVEGLATAGALVSLGLGRREGVWVAGTAPQMRPGRLPGVVIGAKPPTLPGMSPEEEVVCDLWATGVAVGAHPIALLRTRLDALGAVSSIAVAQHAGGRRIRVAGAVTHRQRPATARGVVFLSLEDETGLVNVICSSSVWGRYRRAAQAAVVMVEGRLEKMDGVVNVQAERIEALEAEATVPSRDFR